MRKKNQKRDRGTEPGPLVIREQGSFAVGGTVVQHPGTFEPLKGTPEGQTLHGDHAYVQYQIPENPRRFPLVFVHGAFQFSRCWGSTPDGREGFQSIFLRRGFPVYLVDVPRRGGAGRSTLPVSLSATPDDQYWYNLFRLGIWPDFFPGVRFPRDPESLDQYFRQMTPDTGPLDREVIADAVAALFSRIGPGVLVTHSQGGGVGWRTAIRSPDVRAIVSYEPGTSCIFPEGEVPEPMQSCSGMIAAVGVPLQDFLQLTKIPILIWYADYIPEEPCRNPGQDDWRVYRAITRLFVETVNRHGGRARIISLPEIGISGNTHFPFSDLNNIEIADLLSEFLAEEGLDT